MSQRVNAGLCPHTPRSSPQHRYHRRATRSTNNTPRLLFVVANNGSSRCQRSFHCFKFCKCCWKFALGTILNKSRRGRSKTELRRWSSRPLPTISGLVQVYIYHFQKSLSSINPYTHFISYFYYLSSVFAFFDVLGWNPIWRNICIRNGN